MNWNIIAAEIGTSMVKVDGKTKQNLTFTNHLHSLTERILRRFFPSQSKFGQVQMAPLIWIGMERAK